MCFKAEYTFPLLFLTLLTTVSQKHDINKYFIQSNTPIFCTYHKGGLKWETPGPALELSWQKLQKLTQAANSHG